jgi:muconate cycloisomerase
MEVAHGLASRFCSDNIYISLHSDSGASGYGECVPRFYVTGETPESVLEAVSGILAPLARRMFSSPDEVVSTLGEAGSSATGSANPAALCAVELALLDLAGRHWECTASDILGIPRTDTPLFYSLVAPLMPEDRLERFLTYASVFRFRHVKVKVDALDPAGRVRRVKSLLPPGSELRVDANCSWSAEKAPGFIDNLCVEGVVSVEQPLPAWDIAGMAGLRGRGVLVTLDESVRNPADVERAASMGACDMVNVRISKCGGLLGALRTVHAAERNGIGIQLGAQVGESCILSAAGALLAAGVGSFRWHEGSFGTHLLTEDLCRKPFRFGMGGELIPPDGPGLGIAVDPERMRGEEADG